MKEAFVNGKIFTSDKERPFADCFIAEDGRIVWIGDRSDMPAFDGKITDLQGKRVLPGFIDAHMHAISLANFHSGIPCLPPSVCSIADLVKVIKAEAAGKPEGEFIVGRGYDEGKFAENRSPNRYDLDEASSEHPVYVVRNCGHVAVANSKALALAGINRDTPDPQGGEIVRDENGEPTGVLYEHATHLVSSILPKASLEKDLDSLMKLDKILLSHGIVAVTDMGFRSSTPEYARIYETAAERGFKQEVGVFYSWSEDLEEEDVNWAEPDKASEAQIRCCGVKLIADGSVGGRTAHMYRPYNNTEDIYGLPVCSDKDFEDAIEFCKKHHIQLAVHAMGMRAIDRSISKAVGQPRWTEGIPHMRIEHATDPSEAALAIAREYGVAFTTQDDFPFSEIESYRKNLGLEWIKRTYPIKHILESGVKLALSTDAPATAWGDPSDPLINIMFAVTRKAYDGTDCGIEQAIDVQTAVELYTREAAEVTGFHDLGKLKEGYKANFTVLDKDIFEVEAESIKDIRIEKTYIKGECVFEK